MGERQRRSDGVPEQQRPRDRTGRPLPYDTTETLLTEEHQPVDVEQALALGRELWNQQRFFEAHECLEAVWHAAPRLDRNLWQGVIQIAVAQVHCQRQNPPGAVTLYRRAVHHLNGYPDVWRGIDVAALLTGARHAIAAFDAGTEPAGTPRFPDAGGGAWFARDDHQDAPATSPTALVTTPRWVTEGERRVPQRKTNG